MKHNFRAPILFVVAILSLTAAVGLRAPRPQPARLTDPIAVPRDEMWRIATDNSAAAPGSCTIFTVSKGDTVFFGNTEDWMNPNTYIWTIRATRGRHGAVFFGFDDFFPQGGVNDQGLAYDVNALPTMPLNPHPELPPAPGRFGEHLLAKNATVEEAIAYITGHSWGTTMRGQYHLADASGDAAVIGAGPDKELAVTRKEPGNGYLVSTNFSLVAPQVGGHPCVRYDTATAMLQGVMGSDDLAVPQVANILDAVHQEGPEVNTVYANAVDLSRGAIYLYHWYQFDEVVTLKVSDTIGRFTVPVPISDLFSPQTVERAERAYRRHQDSVTITRDASVLWLGLTGLSLAVQLLVTAGQPRETLRERLGGFISTLFVGPFALLVRFLAPGTAGAPSEGPGHRQKWLAALRSSLVRAAGSTAVWLLAVAYIAFINPEPGPLEVLGATYVLPLLVGLFIWRGLPYARLTGTRYAHAVRRLAVSEVIAHNLAFGAMFFTLFIFSDRWFPDGIQGASPLLWVIFTLVTVAGALAVLPFEAWMAYRGITLWPWRAPGEQDPGALVSLNLRTAWPVLAFSFALALALLTYTASQLF